MGFTDLLLGLVAFSLWYIFWRLLVWGNIFGGNMEGNVAVTKYTPPQKVVCISKRCMKCGMQPAPGDMNRLWGYNWEDKTMCKNCRSQDKTLVVMVAKLKGHPVEEIREWWLGVPLREYMRKLYIEIPGSTKLYISDGDRFWNWVSWPHNKERFTSFDDFIKACPDWKMVKPGGELEDGKRYPEN